MEHIDFEKWETGRRRVTGVGGTETVGGKMRRRYLN